MLAAAGRFVGSPPETTTWSRAPFDATRLVETASREGLSGILAMEVESFESETGLALPSEALTKELTSVFFQNGRLRAELQKLESAFGKERVPAIVFKGAALLHSVYRDASGLRPMSDVDLLVRPEHESRARRALRARGYRSPTETSPVNASGFGIFDLHTDLLGTSRVRGRASAFRFDDDLLWKRVRPLGVGSLGTLDDTHHFLYLAVHALKHGYSRLIWLVDLAALAKSLDWCDVAEQAKRTGTDRALAYAIRALDAFLPVDVPESVRDELPRLGLLERRLLDRLLERRHSLSYLGEVLMVFSIRGLSSRLAYLFELVFPRPRALRRDGPQPPLWKLYPKRLGRLFQRGLRSAASTAESLETGD